MVADILRLVLLGNPDALRRGRASIAAASRLLGSSLYVGNSADHGVVVADVPVLEDAGQGQGQGLDGMLAGTEADVVNTPAAGPSDGGAIPFVPGDLVAARPLQGEALELLKVQVEVPQKDQGGVRKVRRQTDEAGRQLILGGAADGAVGQVDAPDQEGGANCRARDSDKHPVEVGRSNWFASKLRAD